MPEEKITKEDNLDRRGCGRKRSITKEVNIDMREFNLIIGEFLALEEEALQKK